MMDNTLPPKKVILIVEDELPLRNALKEAAMREGYETLEAGNGEKALDVAFEHHPDLILLDLMMPKMNGMEMMEKLRDDDWGKSAKIIILTNLSNDEKIMNETMKAEPTFYLIKADNMLVDVFEKIKEVLSDSGQNNTSEPS